VTDDALRCSKRVAYRCLSWPLAEGVMGSADVLRYGGGRGHQRLRAEPDDPCIFGAATWPSR
jgi:hypothetical protein